ncbi:MAG: cold shock domain-containing protein [Deltaproteobacteria bacterium]|nr:cold shock domain-containing protein [Deltaproteobacteria bacterium]
MYKVMIFIDGTWLYRTLPRLAEQSGKGEFKIDYGVLPQVVARELAERLGVEQAGIDVVRNHIFASLPTNYDHQDEGLITRQNEFYKLLREDYHYETELFNIDFRGRRVRQADRDPSDSFQPREKCVDIALASKMLYQAAMPFGMDIAAAVLGDRDFTPVLQTVRQLGKRVMLVSVRSSCAQELADPEDRERVKDYDTLWMDDHIEELELRYEPQWLECQSPEHEGDRAFQTTYRPRRGEPVYCDACRAAYAQRRVTSVTTSSYQEDEEIDYGPQAGLPVIGETLEGVVEFKKEDKGYGFVTTDDGVSFFFHLSDLEGLDFETLEEGREVVFEVKTLPVGGKAGAAQDVRSIEYQEEDQEPLEDD